MKLDEIQAIIKLLEKSNLQKLQLKTEHFEVSLEKPTGEVLPVISTPVVAPQASAPPVKSSDRYIVSPMVGTFYSASAPDKPCFVKVGDTVEANTVVCIIEAMKVMNEVKAGVKGVISKILIEEGQPVEFGSKLFQIS